MLAYILPKCEVILFENKEESLKRAEARVDLLGLENVTFFQCNLNNFTGRFDIGVACHACGTGKELFILQYINVTGQHLELKREFCKISC